MIRPIGELDEPVSLAAAAADGETPMELAVAGKISHHARAQPVRFFIYSHSSLPPEIIKWRLLHCVLIMITVKKADDLAWWHSW